MTDFFNKTFRVYRVSEGDNYDTEASIGSGLCHIQMIQDRTQLSNQSDWGKEYIMYCSVDANIQAGDSLIIDSWKYGVIGVGEVEDVFEASDMHKTLIISRKGRE